MTSPATHSHPFPAFPGAAILSTATARGLRGYALAVGVRLCDPSRPLLLTLLVEALIAGQALVAWTRHARRAAHGPRRALMQAPLLRRHAERRHASRASAGRRRERRPGHETICHARQTAAPRSIAGWTLIAGGGQGGPCL